MLITYNKEYSSLKYLLQQRHNITSPMRLPISIGWDVGIVYDIFGKLCPNNNQIVNKAVEMSKEDGITILSTTVSIVSPTDVTVTHIHIHEDTKFKRLHIPISGFEDSYLEVESLHSYWMDGTVQEFTGYSLPHRPINNGSTDRIVLVVDIVEGSVDFEYIQQYYIETAGRLELL